MESVPSKKISIKSGDELSTQLLQNLSLVEEKLSPYIHQDPECLQVTLEARWLKSLLEFGEFALPDWELTLIKVTRNNFASKYPQIKKTLYALAQQLDILASENRSK